MKAYIIAILIGATIAAGLFISFKPSNERTYADLERERIAVQSAQATAPAWIIAQYLIIVGIPALLLSAGAVALYRFFRKPPTVRPDQAGRLPVLLDTANRDQYFALAAATLADYHQVERQRATLPQPVPHTYSPHTTYSPHSAPSYASGSAQLPAGDAVTVLDALQLPESVALAEFMPQIKAHCLAFGVDTSGRLLQAPLSQSYHLLSSGRTRSGKSNSLNLILAQLHYQQRNFNLKASISVLDYKRELSAIWSRSSLVELSTTDPGDMVDLLRDLVHGSDGLLARQDLFAREGQKRGRVFGNLVDYERGTGESLRRHYIAIDELNAVLIAADDKRLGDELAQLLYLGAGAGFFVIGGAHQLDASTFKRAAKEQFSTRLQFGPFDQSAVNLMYGSIKVEAETVALLDGRSGRGLVQLVSQSRPVAFQALHVEESDLLPYIDQRPDVETIETIRLLDDQAATVTAQRLDNDAPIAEHTRRAIWERKQSGMTKADIIRALWNVPKGGSAAYRAASALYDRVLAGGPPEGLGAGA